MNYLLRTERSPRLGLLLVPITLCALVGASGQETAVDAATARALERAVEQVQALDDELGALRAERAELRSELTARRERLDSDLRALEQQLSAAREARQSPELAKSQANAAHAADTERLATLVEEARALVLGMLARGAHGVPSVRVDLARLEAHAAALDAPDSAIRASAARDLATEAADAVARWRRRGIESVRVTPPGTDRSVHAWVVHLGTVGAWFLDERGQYAGFASRDAEAEWQPLVDSGDRAAVARAAERLQGRRGTAFDAIPIVAPVRIQERGP